MAFAGYAETQRRRARFRGANRRGGARGGARGGVYVLGRVPVTLPTLAALALCSLVTAFLLASRMSDRDRSVEPGSAQMSSFAAAVGAGAMRRGERDPTLDGELGTQTVADARWTARETRARGASALGPSAAFCALPFDPLVCAHGTVGASFWPAGSSVERPLPNTVPALAAVVAAGHACVEVDVSRSKDGHLVALHARELRRLTANRHANVGELTLEEILNLPVPGGGYSVATFAEAMATVMHRGLAQITVDFKEDETKRNENVSNAAAVPGAFRRVEKAHVASSQSRVSPRSSSDATRGFGQAVLSAIAAVDETGSGCPECVFWGKSDDVMLEILNENPEARVGFTVANFSRAVRDAGLGSVDPNERELIRRASASRRASAFAMGGRSGRTEDLKDLKDLKDFGPKPIASASRVVAAVQSEMIAPALTRRLRGENVPDVYAWTVNDEASVRRVANHGVHGIVTDEPEEATRVVRSMRATCDAPLKKKKNPKSPPRGDAADADPARPRASASGRKASPGRRGRDEG